MAKNSVNVGWYLLVADDVIIKNLKFRNIMHFIQQFKPVRKQIGRK